ncbi:GntR family transcriptional regulator / MocR family aminotransferase [Niastella yeongjuensis]|nr:GntR family transcriptional regulator / MocR family aminotransferase [Niastella yeongjuensis]
MYVQIANELIKLIRGGKLTPGAFLPGTREMADLLAIHRKTIINAYEDLSVQGWIESLPRKGYRVVSDLPVIKPRSFQPKNNYPATSISPEELLHLPAFTRPGMVNDYQPGALIVDDGFPDINLTPYDFFLQQYRQQLNSGILYTLNFQKEEGGLLSLRTATSSFLNQTRGLNITHEQVAITRGAQMAIYLAAALLIKPGDRIIVSEPSYFMANQIFQQLGAVIHRVPVDEEGMDTNALEELLKTGTFKLIYVIPHHHHPTTVTMSTARRIQLLTLIKEYQLWAIEDDYDYDFHYRNSPILPLASADHDGRILYIGSYTKLLGPSFRIGYLVAGVQIIEQAIRYRRLMDIRGDFMMESALAALIDNGELSRHINRSKKIYAARLDKTTELLTSSNIPVSFHKPQGGMALWLRFDPQYPLANLLTNASANNLHLYGTAYFEGYNTNYNSLRFGFASLQEQQMEQAVSILAASLKKK